YTEIGTHADATGAPGTLGYDGALPDAHSYPAASAPEFTKLEEEEKQMPIITPREAAISEAPREFADRNDDPVNESEIPPRPDSRLSIESDRSVISSVSSHTVTSET
ncbi:hypothetical protein EBR96_09150, partial [bacterium]|nr:hypothetical protein [bacterium]